MPPPPHTLTMNQSLLTALLEFNDSMCLKSQSAARVLSDVTKAAMPSCVNSTVWDLCGYHIMDATL